jgi:4-hydroxythreonine-4-phosphate dehydrogenase
MAANTNLTAFQSPIARLVLTAGEPAGIGPDVCLGALTRDWPCELVVAGSRAVLEARASRLNLGTRFRTHDSQAPARPHRAGSVPVIDLPTPEPVIAGKLDARNARHVLSLLDRALEGCRTGEFLAMVTAPVQKSIINEGGIAFTGHTEYLADRLGVARPVMMLVAGNLRVALVTTHLPLARVPAAISKAAVTETIRTVAAELRSRWKIARPRITVCGLNPHAGESGHLGDEEIRVIGPAVEALRREGLDLLGPIPADTAFTPGTLEGIDAVIAMYHDQGLPVLKAAGFGHAVNVTLGLPIVRTSVDHGTALDLAGTGRADSSSLVAAIDTALALAC